ncbi:MAG TPA: hypothetical protein VFT22_38915 [Kofleriaceae bacterium]|nr:hypothetical protein [Kofleriaceae bacterium]
MQIMKPRARTLVIGAAVVVGVVWYVRHRPGEPSSVIQTRQPVTASPAKQAVSPESTGIGSAEAATPSMFALSGHLGSAARYPVNLDALRARLPGNRYWTLGAPTSDPAVAKARAERAERDNVVLGRIQTGEATPDEVRAYYAERRAISRDYLQLAELVLAEQGEALPERDRGMFELSVTMHRARLSQIDRDEADALARHAAR